jgi:hypothetical protein
METRFLESAQDVSRAVHLAFISRPLSVRMSLQRRATLQIDVREPWETS